MVYHVWPRFVRHRNDKLADNRIKNLVACSRSVIQRQAIAARLKADSRPREGEVTA